MYNLVADGSVFEPKSFAELAGLREAVEAILRKYVDKFYGVRRQRWDSENMVLRELDGGHPNFADYTVKIKSSEKALVDEVKALASRANGAHDGEAGSLPNIRFDRHLYQPLLKERGDEIKVSPPGLEESEEKFISALERYCRGENGDPTPGRKLFLLRNLTRNKGVGFFNTAGFYPDFILWAKEADGSQKVVFVEPHGMRNDDPPPNNEKVDLYLALRDLSDRIGERDGPGGVSLDSYVVSATPYEELSKKWGEGWTRDRFPRKHVLFEDELEARIPALLEPRDELERRILIAYPAPLASNFRSLAHVVDVTALYKEQLRVAENVLAFLASVSLALVREEDRGKAGLDLEKYWRGGISPGDWKDIVGKCSKVFAGYRDVPLATAIYKLKVLSEKGSFGKDVIELIRAKNDYKHDRGPATLEELSGASDEVQHKLRRCMEALSFLADYPIRETVAPNRNGSRGKGLFIDIGVDERLPLYPFIVPMTRLDRETEEVYFVDAWDRRRHAARMKSFETGHTITDAGISDSLSGWENSE